VTARYAIYFSPVPDSALAHFGAAWLAGDAAARPAIEGFSASRTLEMTKTARHYGFHATLKAPFALADGQTEAALDRALAEFAQRHAPVARLRLQVGALDGFLALLLSAESTGVRNLAAASVRELDAFRRPPSEAELRRRRQAPLSTLEDALLRRWGYPYVMEAFRFHMTLTSRLPEDERVRLLPALQRMAEPVTDAAFTVDAVSLFQQEDGDRPFRLLRRYPLDPGKSRNIATKDATDCASGPSLTSVRTSPPST
jgi:2'-5' RNA ligase